MPADTFSNGLGYLQMQTGNDNNTWGVNANVSVFQIFEDSIAGQLVVNTTGGTTDLSGSPPPAGPRADRYSQIVIAGSLTSNATIKVCQLPKIWQVINQTSGGFDVLMQTSNAGAVPITIPNGKMITVGCISTTKLQRSDHDSVGEYVALGYVPTLGIGGQYGGGLLAANGQAVSRTGKVDLFNVFGIAYGAGDGSTTFNLPNAQDTGRYLRSYVPGTTTVGTTQSNVIIAHTHTFSGTSGNESVTHTHTTTATTGTESANHVHDTSSLTDSSLGLGYGYFGGGTLVTRYTGSLSVPSSTQSALHTHSFSAASGTESANHTHTTSGTTGSAGAGTETRPETMIAYMGIRY
jgi:hypothetical protein